MQTHKKLLSSVLTGSFSLLLGISFLPLQAQAGFEWVPADQVQTSSSSQTSSQSVQTFAPPVSSSAASSQSQQVDLPAPLVIQGTTAPAKADASPASRAPLAPASASSSFLTAPASASADLPAPSETLPSSEAEIAPETSPTVRSLGTLGGASETASTPAATTGKILRGFANDVPLAVAMRQILPPDYGFSIDKDVSASLLVSWKGGASWRDTLQSMLQKEGLSMEEKGALVRISRSASALSAASASAPISAPAPALASPEPAFEPAPAADASQKPLDLTAPVKPTKMASVPDSSNGHFLQPPAAAVPVSSAHTIGVPLVTHDIGDGTPQSKMVDSWVADRGQTLRAVLEAWSKKANVEMSWLSEYDYPIQASLSFTGTYEDAIRGILSGLQDAKPQPVAVLHNNQASGQSILVVQSRGNNYND